VLRIVTNDLDAPAREIADLYKRRWAIELFFRWIKQNLKIKSFMGTSENAVRTQVFIALIAFVLVRLAYTAQTAVTSMVRFTRVIGENLMDGRSIDELLAALDATPVRRRRDKPPPTATGTSARSHNFRNDFAGDRCMEF
jgi:hypothetical protein